MELPSLPINLPNVLLSRWNHSSVVFVTCFHVYVHRCNTYIKYIFLRSFKLQNLSHHRFLRNQGSAACLFLATLCLWRVIHVVTQNSFTFTAEWCLHLCLSTFLLLCLEVGFYHPCVARNTLCTHDCVGVSLGPYRGTKRQLIGMHIYHCTAFCLIFLKFYQSIVVLQCCVSFGCTGM